MSHFGFSLLPIGISAGLIIMFMLMIPSSTDGMEITVKSSKTIPKASNFLTKLIMRASSSSQNERSINISLKSEQTVAVLKQAIKKETDIPPEQQLIRHNSPSGDVLTDGDTLKDIGLEKAQVFLSFGELEILVKNGTESFVTRVDKTDTVATLKEAIKEKFGIPNEKQKLRRSNHPTDDNNILEDAKTMGNYQILNGATILLSSIFTLNVETDEAWLILQMKDKIKNNVFTVKMKSTDSVLRLKQKIAKSIGRYFSLDLQTLRQNDGLALKDHQTMDFYKIKEGQTILLTFHEFEIVIKYGKKEFSVNVKQPDTVETLKKRIENIKLFGNIPHQHQVLIRWNNDIVLEEDSEPLNEYYVGKDETVIVSWKEFEILVDFKGNKETIKVQYDLSLKGLKKKIKEKFGIPLERQKLARLYKKDDSSSDRIEFCHGDDPTMYFYDIVKGDTISVSEVFKIFVYYTFNIPYNVSGPVKVEVNAGDTVKIVKEKIKAMIEKKWGHYNGQLVEMELRKKDKSGEVLDNDKTIEEAGIKEEGDRIYASVLSLRNWLKYKNVRPKDVMTNN